MYISVGINPTVVADAAVREFLRLEEQYLTAAERADAIVILVNIQQSDLFDGDIPMNRDTVTTITKTLRDRKWSPVARAMAASVLKSWMTTDPDDDDEIVVILKGIIDG